MSDRKIKLLSNEIPSMQANFIRIYHWTSDVNMSLRNIKLVNIFTKENIAPFTNLHLYSNCDVIVQNVNVLYSRRNTDEIFDILQSIGEQRLIDLYLMIRGLSSDNYFDESLYQLRYLIKTIRKLEEYK